MQNVDLFAGIQYLLDVELCRHIKCLLLTMLQQIFSPKEVKDHLTRIQETLSNSTCDWEKRVEAVIC